MTQHEYIATCHTEGCGNVDIPIPMVYDDDFGPLSGVYCGPCGQEITDLAGLPAE